MKKIGLKKTLFFERTFEVIKIDLYSCRVFHFSLDIFGFSLILRYLDFWEVRNITEVVEQSHLKLCMCVYIHYTRKTLAACQQDVFATGL